MAAGRHNLTRRALLGAGVGACAIAAAPGAAPAFAPSLSKCASWPLRRPDEDNGLRQARPERDGGKSARSARWAGALAAYRRAEAACEAFRDRRLGPASEAHRAIRARWPPAHDCRADPEARALLEPAFALVLRLEDQADDLECARLAALRRLLRRPAPDLPALALKLALVVDDQAWELTGAGTILAALKADAGRLCRAG